MWQPHVVLEEFVQKTIMPFQVITVCKYIYFLSSFTVYMMEYSAASVLFLSAFVPPTLSSVFALHSLAISL